jgi:hypothetical protein
VIAAVAPQFASPGPPHNLLGGLTDTGLRQARDQPDAVTRALGVAFDLTSHAVKRAERTRSADATVNPNLVG